MPSSQLRAAGYLLVESPGIIRATTLGPTGVLAGELTAGEKIDERLGVRWDDLVHATSGVRELVTPHGTFGVEALRDKTGAITAMLLVLVEAPRVLSTVPPSSAPRLSLGLETVAGKDPSARAAVDLALRLAKTMLPLYIGGEDGAGADVLARAVARASGREHAPFVHVRVGGPSDQAISDLLSGGNPALAGQGPGSRGTLYVEDIGELDVEVGRTLARELDRGVLADAHFIASGPVDLRERVAAGTFAKELFTLIRSSTVTLPPLRDREDFDHVVRSALTDIAASDGREDRGRIDVSPESMRLLRSHAWPSNLRELTAWLERAVATADPERTLRPEHFPKDAAEASKTGVDLSSGGLRNTAERAALEEALRAAGGNVSLAAKKLGVARSTLYRMKQKHKVEP